MCGAGGDVAEKLIGDKADLRYLEANNVRCSLGNLADFQVCTSDAKSLGNIEGVLISPSTRRCEYFVIESRSLFEQHRFLLPVVETGAIVEEPKTLKIAARKDELNLEKFTPSSVPQFSDEDLITTIFAQDAA
jgi:hypothetical protein